MQTLFFICAHKHTPTYTHSVIILFRPLIFLIFLALLCFHALFCWSQAPIPQLCKYILSSRSPLQLQFVVEFRHIPAHSSILLLPITDHVSVLDHALALKPVHSVVL